MGRGDLSDAKWPLIGPLLQTLVDPGLTDDWQHNSSRPRLGSGRERSSCAGFWSITRRLYEPSPRSLRQSRTAYRVQPDRR
jgi:hypothetical protein